MTILTNFKVYTPEDPADFALMEEHNVIFLKSAEGVDWYKSQSLFKPDLLKIIFDWKTGIIFGAHKDVTTLPSPEGACVADVDYDPNTSVEDLLDKIFDPYTGKIKDRVYTETEIKAQIKDKIARLQSDAALLITPLQYAKDLDMLSDDEAAYLKELQRYVVYLSRVTSQEGYPDAIEWPELPTK